MVFFSNIKYLVWMVFSQGMLESNQGLYRLKKVALVHFFLNQNWIAAWFPPIIITSWLRWEYTPAKHPLPHTVYIYVWQLCGLPSSIFHFRKKKKTHSTNASLNMYMSASAVLYRFKPCILVGGIGGNSANLNTGLLYLLQI